MPDFSDFNPNTVDDFVEAMINEVKDLGQSWWSTNKEIVPGYLRSLAEASLQTQAALASGLIDKDAADQAVRMQQAAFRQTVRFMKYMTLALSQRIVDTVFSLIGWALFNRTGVNFFPELVSPE
ncbi:MAG: hypothetical protein AAGC95_09260 [Pseudomonadota bacterium]